MKGNTFFNNADVKPSESNAQKEKAPPKKEVKEELTSSESKAQTEEVKKDTKPSSEPVNDERTFADVVKGPANDPK